MNRRRFLPVSTAAVLLSSLMLTACQKAATDHLQEAQAAIAAKDSAAAVLHLKNAIATDPANAEARLLMGQQSMALNDFAAAAVDFKRARELKLPDERVVPLLAEAMLYSGQERLLIEQLGTVRLSAPDAIARLQTHLAMAYLALGSTPKAKQAVDAALAAQPNAPDPRLVQARITLRESGLAPAKAEVEALLRDSPRFDQGWTFKGTLHATQPQESGEALESFQKALEIDPRQFQALFSTVALHMSAGDLKKAREGLANLQKLWPQSVFGSYLEGRMLLLEGRHNEARPIFAQLRNSMPENVALLLASGVNELKLNAPIQAEALLAQTVSLDPKSVPARYFLAQSNLQLGRPERASQALAPLLADPEASPEVIVLAAQARLYQGDARGASDLYARAEKFKSSNESVRTALAMAKVARGDVDAALKELQIIADTSADIDADLKLVSTRLARNELPAALAAIERLERKKPDLATTLDLRGQVLLLQKEPAKARAAFEAALLKDKGYVPAISQLTNLDLQERKVEQAEQRVKAALAASPDDARLLTMMAAIKAKTNGSAQEVLALIEQATRADPKDVNAWLMLMTRHYQAGDLQTALTVGQTATTMIPDNVQLLEMVGRTQLRAGDTRQAGSTFANLIRVAPRSASGYIGQAATLVASNELDAAGKVLQRLIDREPDSIDARRLAADVALRRKRPDEALVQAKELQRRHPASAAGFRLEGVVEQSRNNLQGAAAAFRKAVGKADSADVSVRLYDVLRRGGKPGEADQFAADWLQTNPKDTSLMSFRGFLLFQGKDLPAARKQFEAVLAAEPEHVESLNNLALVLLQQNEAEQAQTMAERALTLQPNRPEILDTLAQVLLARKQHPKAIETLKLAINRATDAAPLRLALAKVYIQADDRANAMAELEALVALGKNTPTFAEARQLLAAQRRR